MKVTPLAVPGPLLIEPRRHGDARGFFSEVWSRTAFAAAGLAFDWCQDNHSLSRRRGTVRGLHYQLPPSAQVKLVRVTRGRVWDVAVDLRRSSASFGQHVAVELSAENWRQLLIPAGFAHGFATLEDDCEVLYKVDAPYDPATDRALRWDDPAIALPWPVAASEAILSDRDRAAPLLADAELFG